MKTLQEIKAKIIDYAQGTTPQPLAVYFLALIAYLIDKHYSDEDAFKNAFQRIARLEQKETSEPQRPVFIEFTNAADDIVFMKPSDIDHVRGDLIFLAKESFFQRIKPCDVPKVQAALREFVKDNSTEDVAYFCPKCGLRCKCNHAQRKEPEEKEDMETIKTRIYEYLLVIQNRSGSSQFENDITIAITEIGNELERL